MGLAEAAAAYEVGTGWTGIGLDLADFGAVGLGKEVDAEGCLIGVDADFGSLGPVYDVMELDSDKALPWWLPGVVT